MNPLSLVSAAWVPTDGSFAEALIGLPRWLRVRGDAPFLREASLNGILPWRAGVFADTVGHLRLADLPWRGGRARGALRLRLAREIFELDGAEAHPGGEARAGPWHEQRESLLNAVIGVFEELHGAGNAAAGKGCRRPTDDTGEGSSAAGYRVAQAGNVLSIARVSWPEAVLLLNGQRGQPRMDLIARIAETFAPELRQLVERPRKVLKRERRRIPLARVQELDRTCLQWLNRQPGRSAREKSGARQQILAVSREESFDLLENRVLKDFLRLCVLASERFLRESAAFKGTARFKLVDSFGRFVREFLRRDFFSSVSALQSLPKPNHALQFDPLYRQLWSWYLRLVHRESELDRIWPWQHRLWSDFARLFTGTFFQRLEALGWGVRPSHGHWLRVRNHHEWGGFLFPQDWPGPSLWLLSENERWVFNVLHPESRADEGARTRLRTPTFPECGADLVLHFSTAAGFAESNNPAPPRCACVLVFALLVECPEAQAAVLCELGRLRRRLAEREGDCAFGVLVLFPASGSPCAHAKAGDEGVLGLCLDPDPGTWFDEPFEVTGGWLCRILERSPRNLVRSS
ncbi:MAG: DUF2357 domain-containing protein [Opitutales bacterium]|nr:DUF2357 domain-containing protein [Opitutales bacterium]